MEQTISGYPKEVIEQLVREQVNQGNEVNVELLAGNIEAHKEVGGVNWTETEDGEQFWHKVLLDKDFELFAAKYPVTRVGWLEVLPKEVRDKAVFNANNNQNKKDPLQHTNKLSSALFGAFIWFRTPEGHTYWLDIHSKIVQNE